MAKKDGKESTIGKVIYGFLMFAPLIAVGTTCAYSIFNKNAVNDVTNTVSFDTNDPVDKDNFLTDYVYKLNLTEVNFTSWATIGYCDYLYIETNDTYEFYNKDLQFQIRASNTIPTIRTMIGSQSYTVWGTSAIPLIKCYVVFNAIYDNTYYYLFEQSDITTFTTNELTGIDNRNTFYYSLDRVQEEDVFKWAKNNEIYTGLKAVTDGLTIETEFIPMILSYWLIISVIYFMYDILLIIFHILHNNIHKLESM